MEMTMLGTGNALVTECYNTCFVLKDQNQYLMVDGGGGNQVLHQLKAAGLDWMKMRDIFVTHKHIDHLMGIIWMVRMMGQNMNSGKFEGEARIYGHEEVIGLIREISGQLLSAKQARFLDDKIRLIILSDGEQRSIMEHDITCFDIQSDKAKQFGFSMDLGGGKKLTCCGDETYRPCEEAYVKNSNWLLHEAFCLSSQADIYHPYEKKHSTVKDACELAEKMGVENLLLYHTEDDHIKTRKQLYVEEGRRYFNGGLYVPDDLETVVIA